MELTESLAELDVDAREGLPEPSSTSLNNPTVLSDWPWTGRPT